MHAHTICFHIITSRCSIDTILSHHAYGPTAFSFYKGLPPHAAKRISIIDGDATGSFGICGILVARLQQYLISAYPHAHVVVFPKGTVHEDFFR